MTCARRSVGEAMSQPAFAFERVAVVNRGEPAMRLINAVREWNAESRPQLRTIAVHTAVDKRAMFVREADESVLIGPDDEEGFGSNPYLDYAELERAPDAEEVTHRPGAPPALIGFRRRHGNRKLCSNNGQRK